MPNSFTAQEVLDLPQVISVPRFETYLTAKGGSVTEALALYRWNLQVSAAFFFPLQICEVAIRNGVSESIQDVYGARWPWSQGFTRSLPMHGNYSPRNELMSRASKHPSTGKVIADMKFMFWQKMFIANNQRRIWNRSLFTRFPFYPHPRDVGFAVPSIHDSLEDIRQLRNRIAHHEPIFRRDLKFDYRVILEVIGYRNNTAANWVHNNQIVTALLNAKP